MRSFFLVAAVLAVPACFTEDAGPHDVTGPYSGPITRYVVDRIVVPSSNATWREMGDDLNGDRTVDNQIGMSFSALQFGENLTTHGQDMIASGMIESAVEIQADDASDDPTVRVWYHGTPTDGGEAVGGTLIDGTFASNRTITTHVPGSARVALPVFIDADPLVVTLEAMEIDLVPDGTGGFDATIRGGVRAEEVMQATYAGITQMFRANPHDHRAFWWIVDHDHDGLATAEEVATSSLLQSLLAPDVTLRLRDGSREPLTSFGFRVHLTPCASGRCAPPIKDSCHDRVLDGTETDVDCGGSCQRCGGAARCVDHVDCITGSCTGGICAGPTCTDGLWDGFEAAADCGGGCPACGTGKTCDFDDDCLSHDCAAGDTCF